MNVYGSFTIKVTVTCSTLDFQSVYFVVNVRHVVIILHTYNGDSYKTKLMQIGKVILVYIHRRHLDTFTCI